MFWHGPPLSRIERLCMSSFVAHGHRGAAARLRGARRRSRRRDAARCSGDPAAQRAVRASRSPDRSQCSPTGSAIDCCSSTAACGSTPTWCACGRSTTRDAEIFAWQDERIINNAVLGLPQGHRAGAMDGDCCEQPNRLLPYDSFRMRRRKLPRRLLRRQSRREHGWGETGPTGLTAAADASALHGAARCRSGISIRSPIRTGTRCSTRACATSPRSSAAATGLHLWNEMVHDGSRASTRTGVPDGFARSNSSGARYVRSDS